MAVFYEEETGNSDWRIFNGTPHFIRKAVGKYLTDLEEMHIHYKNPCLVSSASLANFYSSLYEGDFEIDGSLIPDFFQFPLLKLPNISKITYENKIKNKQNKNKIHKKERRERRNKNTKIRNTTKDKRKKTLKKNYNTGFSFFVLEVKYIDMNL